MGFGLGLNPIYLLTGYATYRRLSALSLGFFGCKMGIMIWSHRRPKGAPCQLREEYLVALNMGLPPVHSPNPHKNASSFSTPGLSFL